MNESFKKLFVPNSNQKHPFTWQPELHIDVFQTFFHEINLETI